MRAIVYKNLNRGDWSIATPAGKSGLGRGKVVGHGTSLAIADPVFVVQESGRLRVIAKRCREVHAWIVGDITDSVPAGNGRQITFNPYRAPTFTFRDSGEPVTAASHIEFRADGIVIAFNASGDNDSSTITPCTKEF